MCRTSTAASRWCSHEDQARRRLSAETRRRVPDIGDQLDAIWKELEQRPLLVSDAKTCLIGSGNRSDTRSDRLKIEPAANRCRHARHRSDAVALLRRSNVRALVGFPTNSLASRRCRQSWKARTGWACFMRSRRLQHCRRSLFHQRRILVLLRNEGWLTDVVFRCSQNIAAAPGSNA